MPQDQFWMKSFATYWGGIVPIPHDLIRFIFESVHGKWMLYDIYKMFKIWNMFMPCSWLHGSLYFIIKPQLCLINDSNCNINLTYSIGQLKIVLLCICEIFHFNIFYLIVIFLNSLSKHQVIVKWITTTMTNDNI